MGEIKVDSFLKWVFRIFAGVFSFAVIALTLFLLVIDKLSGAEFASIFAVSIAFVFMVIFASEFQELSLGGAVIKLRDMKNEVEKSVKQLEQDRINMFQVFLRLSLNFSGGFASDSPTDERVGDFLALIDKIRSSGCFQELKQEILKASVLIKNGQIIALSQYCDRSFEGDVEFYNLISIVLSDGIVNAAVNKHGVVESQVRSDLKESLKLLEEVIKVELEAAN